MTLGNHIFAGGCSRLGVAQVFLFSSSGWGLLAKTSMRLWGAPGMYEGVVSRHKGESVVVYMSPIRLNSC